MCLHSVHSSIFSLLQGHKYWRGIPHPCWGETVTEIKILFSQNVPNKGSAGRGGQRRKWRFGLSLECGTILNGTIDREVTFKKNKYRVFKINLLQNLLTYPWIVFIFRSSWWLTQYATTPSTLKVHFFFLFFSSGSILWKPFCYHMWYYEGFFLQWQITLTGIPSLTLLAASHTSSSARTTNICFLILMESSGFSTWPYRSSVSLVIWC